MAFRGRAQKRFAIRACGCKVDAMPPRSRSPSAESTSTATTSLPAISPDGAVLSVLSGPARGRSLRLPGKPGESVTVGKAATNELVIDDPSISRLHLRIRRTEAGLEVTDLESKNGVFVAGARIREALVEPGTVLRAGNVELLVGVELEGVVIPPSEHDHFGLALGTSLEMRRIFGILERIAPTPASVLLTGETGTGKDVLARSIHMQSARADGPFEVVDCGAVSGSLIESELFGHEKGAFTGAVAGRAGAFERAAGGTIFLDEIGELAVDLQPKLLRVLEAREFRRVGGSKTIAADVRIVAATTRDLAREVTREAFREDLYFRLAVVAIHVPPLRARLDDLPVLLARLLAGGDGRAAALPVTNELVAALRSHDWPGNIRELRNVIERSQHVSLALGKTHLELVDFPPVDAADEMDDILERLPLDEDATYRDTRRRFEAAFERRYVKWLLDRFSGNVSGAARAARMDRNHLTELARRHGLDRRR
ncbi:MAG: Type fimbriae expression regulatory protein PilR [Labilithrix sp.]|nr:Type fimbriae expression regulatory protein PilR [Labilithrix sp.]